MRLLLVGAAIAMLCGCARVKPYCPGETFGARAPERQYPLIGNPTAGEVRCCEQ